MARNHPDPADLTAYLGRLSSSASSPTDTGSTIREYTLTQVRVFLEAIARAEREQRRTELLLMHAAQAEGKGFERVWKALNDGA